MPFITLQEERNGENLQWFFQDYGQGEPVILIHGGPQGLNLTHRDEVNQLLLQFLRP